MKTLRTLIENGFDQAKRTEIEAAIAAAYWAGQADARADERQVAQARMTHFCAKEGLGRYWRKVMAAQEAICTPQDRKSIKGLSEEKAEIMACTFTL